MQPLNEVTDQKVTEVIVWAGNRVMDHMSKLELIDKKSDRSGGGGSK
jgi:hypothetical protein